MNDLINPDYIIYKDEVPWGVRVRDVRDFLVPEDKHVALNKFMFMRAAGCISHEGESGELELVMYYNDLQEFLSSN